MPNKQATIIMGCENGQITLRRKIVGGGVVTEKFPPTATVAIRNQLAEWAKRFQILSLMGSSSFDFPEENGVTREQTEAVMCALDPFRGYKVIEKITRVIDVKTLQANMQKHAGGPEELKIWEKCLQDFLKSGTLMFQKPITKKGPVKWSTDRFKTIVDLSVTHREVECDTPK